jgi:hypothetical protein
MTLLVFVILELERCMTLAWVMASCATSFPPQNHLRLIPGGSYFHSEVIKGDPANNVSSLIKRHKVANPVTRNLSDCSFERIQLQVAE